MDKASEEEQGFKKRFSKERILEVLWLLGIFVSLSFFKIRYSIAKKSFEIDGGFYADIARHIRDGQGLTTNLSLYHQAYSYFPHESSVSPLWPLLYGYMSVFFDIFALGIWLPTLLYYLALLAFFFWARRLFPHPIFPRYIPGFSLAHVFVLMLGLHREFFKYTSVPYTEGLAFLLLGLALWRMHKLLSEPNLKHGVEIGLWLSLLFLARAQFFLVVIAVFMTLTWGVLFTKMPKRVLLLNFIGCAIFFVLPIGAYYGFFLATFIDAPPHLALLRFDQGFERPLLSSFDPMVNTKGLWAFIKDRWSGVPVAFSLKGHYAYARSFYTFAYAIIAALPSLIFVGFAERKKWKNHIAFLRTPAALPWMMILLFSLGAFVSMHLIHKDYFSEWHFARRQGTTSLFIFFLSLSFLLKRENIFAVTGIFILCLGIFLGFNTLSKDTNAMERSSQNDSTHYRKNLRKWLNKQGKITVAMSAYMPQKIALMTPDIGYQWIYSKTTPEDLRIIMNDLGARFLILGANTKSWRFRRDKTFQARYRLLKTLSGTQIYEKRR